MTRRLSALSLALIAAFAMSAIVAQGALAATNHTFFATEAPLELDGEGSGVMKSGEAEVTCTTGAAIGQIAETPTDEISLGFSLGGCKLAGIEVTVTNEGCKLAADSDTTTDPNTGGESAPGKIVCEAGKFLKLVGPGCTMDLGSQGPLHGVKYTNVGSAPKEEVKVEAHSFGIEYNATNNGCALLGITKGVHNDATLFLTATARGYKVGKPHTAENQIGIGVETP